MVTAVGEITKGSGASVGVGWVAAVVGIDGSASTVTSAISDRVISVLAVVTGSVPCCGCS